MQPDEKQTRQRDMLLLLTSGEMWVGNFLGHEIDSSHFSRAQLFWWAIVRARTFLTQKYQINDRRSTCSMFFSRFHLHDLIFSFYCERFFPLEISQSTPIPPKK